MSTFGIDYQRGVTAVALREGTDPAARPAVIGDGRSRLIPNAVVGESLWGSAAVGADGVAWGGAGGDGPWLDSEGESGATRFWRALHDRLACLLGRADRQLRLYAQIVVAIQAADMDAAIADVKALARQAGLIDVPVIPASHALLCRWLTDPASAGTAPRTVVAVALGDVSSQAVAARVEASDGILPRVTALGPLGHLPGIGLASWLSELSRTTGGGADTANWLPAALEYLACLASADLDRPLPWAGILGELRKGPATSPAPLSRRQCQTSWPSLKDFLKHAGPALIAWTLKDFDGAEKADVVVLGGCGAAVPVAALEVDHGTQVWVGPDPVHDVARGASYWVQYGAPEFPDAPPSSAKNRRKKKTPSRTSTLPEKPLKPWERVEGLRDS